MIFRKVGLPEAFWFQEGPGVRNWQFTSTGIKLLNVANILKNGTIDLTKTNRHLATEEVKQKYSHFLVDNGDLVIASSGITVDDDGLLRTRGAFVEEAHLPLCMNTSTIRFKAKNGVSDLGYLKHWLQSKEFRTQISREVTGIAQKNFGPSHLQRLKISLPLPEEQKHIAAILDTADEMRAKRRQSITELDRLLQSVFLEMFGDPVTNPKGWEVAPMTELVEGKYGIKAGPFGSSLKKEEYTQSGYRVYGQEQVIAGSLEVGDYYISEQKFRALQTCEVKQGDVLVSLVGSFGRVLVVPEDAEPGIINPRLLKITPNQLRVTSLYVAASLQQPLIQMQLETMSHGGTMGILNAGLIKRLQMSVPLLSVQKEYEVISNLILSQKRLYEHQLAELDTLFASLQQRAFNGELSRDKERFAV